jgi:REP element-mobilizing transposase RayT
MARMIRLEYAGAVYHVMARGNQGRRIYANDADRKLWLDTLAEGCGQTGWRIHAYVLMPNHYHLLAETTEGNLVAGMKWLQSTYTQRYNARHRVFGHLFQGRYKALVVDGAEIILRWSALTFTSIRRGPICWGRMVWRIILGAVIRRMCGRGWGVLGGWRPSGSWAIWV